MSIQINPIEFAGLVRREVRPGERDGRPTKIAIAARVYAADRPEVWDAVTNAERLPRWFLPISGDLRLGGRYQFEGNAGGMVERCEAPGLVAVTWEFGGGISWLEVHLSEAENGTRLELMHEAPLGPMWEQYGPGAVGVGWDLGLLGLGLHLGGAAALDPKEVEAWSLSAEGKSFIGQASQGWADAAIADGMDPDKARAAADQTTTFYTTAPEAATGSSEPVQD